MRDNLELQICEALDGRHLEFKIERKLRACGDEFREDAREARTSPTPGTARVAGNLRFTFIVEGGVKKRRGGRRFRHPVVPASSWKLFGIFPASVRLRSAR